MCKLNFLGLILAILLSSAVFASSTVDEQIDSYLYTLETSDDATKSKMLERLQWSGLRDERLYDVIEDKVLEIYQKTPNMGNSEFKTYLQHIRALGYSGNEKYRTTLNLVKAKASQHGKAVIVRRKVRSALKDLINYVVWNEKIANSSAGISGKSAEITSYFKMLNSDNVLIQRMAAKATFHQQLQDNDLLQLFKSKLEEVYLKPGLSRVQQDVGAWFSKAIGQSKQAEYGEFLTIVVERTPYEKVRKHAAKYAQ